MRTIVETVLMIVVGFVLFSWAAIGLSYVIGESSAYWILGIVLVLYVLYGVTTHKRLFGKLRKEVSVFFMLSRSSDWD